MTHFRLYSFSVAVLILCSFTQFTWAEVEASTSLKTYYAAINGTATDQNDALRQTLHSIINNHTVVSYDNLRYLYKYSDTYDAEGKIIEDIYSECDPAYTESFCKGDCGYNREHSVPKSWFSQETPLYSDAFHLYPTNCYVNSYRSNYPYGECENGTKCKTNNVKAKGRLGNSTFAGYTSAGQVYELDDEYKGDLARTYFYMVTCYITTNFTQDKEGYGSVMFTYSNNTAQLTQYSIDLLMKWHRQDTVSKKELIRNEVIYGNQTYNKGKYKQGNRNPFIDYPELAEYIWGDKKGQTIDLSTLKTPYKEKEDDPGEGFENVNGSHAASKQLINGHLYIQTTDGLFTITGQKVYDF